MCVLRVRKTPDGGRDVWKETCSQLQCQTCHLHKHSMPLPKHFPSGATCLWHTSDLRQASLSRCTFGVGACPSIYMHFKLVATTNYIDTCMQNQFGLAIKKKKMLGFKCSLQAHTQRMNFKNTPFLSLCPPLPTPTQAHCTPFCADRVQHIATS